MDRRSFLRDASGTAVAASLAGTVVHARCAAAEDAANDKIVVAMVGVKGRGNSLLNTFACAARRGTQIRLRS